jgi:glycosyltransferase involved in cell wall biosynthesis
MKVLLCHNYYQQPGGEDQVYFNERAALRERGCDVICYERHNIEIKEMSLFAVLRDLFWSQKTYVEISALLEKEKPDIVHVYNFFPLISPSIYYAIKKKNIPVVQSLHNQRIMCPSGSFVRSGVLCVLCNAKKFAWPGVIFGCYRRSRILSFAVASMFFFHRIMGTWQNKVSCYLVATNFYRELFLQNGLPFQKIEKKALFVDHASTCTSNKKETYALFVGRLDPEKGVLCLLQAWQYMREVQGVSIPLKIRGSGRLMDELQSFISANDLSQIEIVPRLTRKELFFLIQKATLLVWPSLGYYETFGLVAIEAARGGVPVIASDSGVANETVAEGVSGLHFRSGDPIDLAEKVVSLWSNETLQKELSTGARRYYETHFDREVLIMQQIEIYSRYISEQKEISV